MSVDENIALMLRELKELRIEMAEQRKLLTGVSKPQREWWKPREVAARYGIKDIETVRAYCKDGKIDAKKDEYSNQWLIPQSEIDKLDATGGKPIALSQVA